MKIIIKIDDSNLIEIEKNLWENKKPELKNLLHNRNVDLKIVLEKSQEMINMCIEELEENRIEKLIEEAYNRGFNEGRKN
jgi:flagellar biosynthesis/type III secretory pathway protein FliH